MEALNEQMKPRVEGMHPAFPFTLCPLNFFIGAGEIYKWCPVVPYKLPKLYGWTPVLLTTENNRTGEDFKK